MGVRVGKEIVFTMACDVFLYLHDWPWNSRPRARDNTVFALDNLDFEEKRLELQYPLRYA